MTNSKNTKRALLASVLSVMLCVAMLVGSTFAWFTDSVTSGKNQIVAGNLKVDLIHVGVGEEGGDVSIKDTPDHKIFNYDQWEPGYTAMETLKVVNKGSLAFKFRLDAIASGATAAPTGEKLADVIDVYVYEGDGIPAPTSFAAMTEGANWRNAGSLSELMADPDGMAYGVLLPADATPKNDEPVKEVQMTVALHMQEGAGNAYQGLTLGDLSFVLSATQYTFEDDAFDNQYDKDAKYPGDSNEGVSASTVEEINAAFQSGEKTVALSGDIDLSVCESADGANGTYIEIPEDGVLNLNGNKIIVQTFNNDSKEGGTIKMQGTNAVITGGTIVAKDGNSSDGMIWPAPETDVTVENVTFDCNNGGTLLRGNGSTALPYNVTFKGCTAINSKSQVFTDGMNAIFEDCSITKTGRWMCMNSTVKLVNTTINKTLIEDKTYTGAFTPIQ